MEYPKLIEPQEGEIYHNRCGSDYLCKSSYGTLGARMVRIPDGWTCKAHGVRQYADGTIEWDFSTEGHWPQVNIYCGRE